MDPETRVLMLSALKQSTGLTLTNANHVVLFDDVEAGDEQQAIGRVRRIGQTRITHVYKFSMVDPLESVDDPVPQLACLRMDAEAEAKAREEVDNTHLERLRSLFDK